MLRDSAQRPGGPLRGRLRSGSIAGARQEGRLWFIDRLDQGEVTAEQILLPGAGRLQVEPRTRLMGKRTRSASDEAYIIDLCDELLGERALRQHRFDWLRGDPGVSGHSMRLPVDAYYPRHGLVVEYRERQHYEATPFFDRRQTVSGVGRGEQRRRYDRLREREIPTHGLRLEIIRSDDLASDSRGRLRRQRPDDLRILKRHLSSE